MKIDIFRHTRLALLLMLYALTIFGMASSASASADLVWQKCLGGSSYDFAYSVQQTSDSGYIVAGYTDSNLTGDVGRNHGGSDFWVVKLNAARNITWQKCLGGSSSDVAYGNIQQTSDSGYIVAGWTSSNLTGDVGRNHGSADCWVVKLDASGNIAWQKCLGGSSPDVAYSVQQTADSGYIIAGYTYSNLTGDVGRNNGYIDYWLVKLDGSGNITWQKCLGGTSSDVAHSVQQTSDGGYIVAGWTSSNLTGDVGRNNGGEDFWVVKLDASGNITWRKCLGGSSDDYALSVQQTSDSGYIVAGGTSSNLTGDVGRNHGGEDFWVVKLDASGNITWQKCLGGSNYDTAPSVQQTADSGYIVAGYTESNLTGDVGRNNGYIDYWLVKLDGSGNITWQKCLGGSSADVAESVQQTSDSGYIVAGYTYSNLTGDVGQNHGFGDYWVVKLGLDTRFMESYEDLLRSQFGLLSSFENLLKNATLNSSMSTNFLDGFDDLSDRQQRGLYSFEDIVSFSWSELDASQKIKLTASYEDLLRRQATIIASNEDLLTRAFCKLGAKDKEQLLDRYEDRVKFEVVLLKKFENWLHHPQMMEETEYNSWIAFLSSFEDLIRRQSDLLDGFETLMKIDCNDTYINVTKSVDSLHVQAGDPVNYTYTVTANDSDFDVKDITVKDSLWGEVGTIALLKGGTSQELTITRPLSCADCDECQCKICNFATVCGEVTTVNGNFTVCDVSNEVCIVVEDYDPCSRAGGTVEIRTCCNSAPDFPNTCRIGACSCGPESSKDTKVCNCGAGKCFNGTACVPIFRATPMRVDQSVALP